MHQHKLIAITGATSAIGSALALHYARPGCTLMLQGRDTVKLDSVALACRARGAEVNTYQFDLTHRELLLQWIAELLANEIPDMVIANAGMNINTGPDQQGEPWEHQQQLLELNINSTLLLANQMADAMKQRGAGQIVLMSSLAAHYGLPVTPSYSASKAAIKAYGEGLRGWLAPHGVGVSVIMPGYVKSAMCDEMPGPKPFLWSPERAANVIARGVAKNRARVSFPFPLNFGTWWLAVLPASLSQRIVSLLGYDH